jgi:hypothetical protein
MELLRRFGPHFELRSYTDDCVLVLVSVPGERWEVEFFHDGRRTFERLSSSGALPADGAPITELVEDFGEK